MGETARMGANLVRSCAGGDKAEYQGWILAAKARKGKEKKNPFQSGVKGKKQDLSKVKCFHCHQHGHFATNCPQKKKNKKVARSAAGEALTL